MAIFSFRSLIIVASTCLLLIPSAQGLAAIYTQPTECMETQAGNPCPWLTESELRFVLNEALNIWPVPHDYNYGTFRSALNHGTLTLEPVEHVLGRAVNVNYAGITACVLIPA